MFRYKIKYNLTVCIAAMFITIMTRVEDSLTIIRVKETLIQQHTVASQKTSIL